ncbi:MAG TPA: HAMP domain-containing protein, partial [Candidatus Omnitrophica bacterium]|nr:HAMP domain-containing protein [Candidatus Omnitrophota bacterium]
MRKFKITTKILLALIALSLCTLVLFGYVVITRMNELGQYALSRNVSLGEKAVSDSKNALVEQSKTHLLKIAQDQAAISNAFLEKVENEVNFMAQFASRIWAEGGFVKGRHSYYIDEKPKDILAASCYFIPKGVNRSYLETEIDLSSSMDEIFAPIYANDSNLDSVYLGTALGLFRNYPWSSDLEPSYDHRKRLWYKEAIKNKRMVWSKPYINVGTNELIVTCSKPFYSPKNKLIGVVAADVTLKVLNNYILNTQIGKKGYSFLIDNEGNLIAHPGINAGGKKWNEKYLTRNLLKSNSSGLRKVVRGMIEGKTGIQRFEGDPIISGDDKYVAYAPLTSTKWSLGVAMPVSEIIAPALTTAERISLATTQTAKDIRSRIKNVMYLIGGIFLVTIIVVWGLAHRISKRIALPILKLKEGVQIVGKGNLDYRLNIKTGDEIEELASAFNKMAEDLKNHIEHLKRVTAENERIESELKIARNIQASMLPRVFPPFPERREFDIFATMVPAKEVGGDLYDFFFVDKNKLCLIIGDVSGKGVPASLFMAISKILLKREAMEGVSANEILARVNDVIVTDNQTCMFVTLFCVILDTDTGKIEFSNGGHNPPLIARAGGDFEFMNVPAGFVVGAMEDVKFTKGELTLSPGDGIFLYTDGV